MATLANGQPTLLDASTQFTSDGKPLPIAELLHKTNPALNDIPWEMANSSSGHIISARQQLPPTALRRINGGVPPTKSQYGTIVESMGLFSALGQVDSKLVELAGDKARFRMNENEGHMESMGQRFFQSLFYGDTDVTQEEFLGLSPRFDSLNAANNTSMQILDAGGNDTDLTSIWLVGWGSRSVMGIYPKGSQAGIVHKDMGEELVSDGAGGQYPALRDWFELDAGLAVYDYRNIVRIANIDLSALTADASAGAKLIDLMTLAVEGLNGRAGLNPVFYVPRKVRAYLRLQIKNKSNVWLSLREVAGEQVESFDGIPVRRVDSLALNEARIT
jgi:hypothetical protein